MAFGGSDPIGAREAWTKSHGRGVVVAVIDTGVQIDHPDLAGSIWTNPDEVANGVDDDANGIVDDVHGANLQARSGDVSDDIGHGTHIAGIIAARAGNGIGGSGIAPEAQIMPVKAFSTELGGGVLESAIRYAVEEGAQILSISMNRDSASSAFVEAVRFAEEQGATIVASAANHGRNIDAQPSYPASSDSPAVLGVTAARRPAA